VEERVDRCWDAGLVTQADYRAGPGVEFGGAAGGEVDASGNGYVADLGRGIAQESPDGEVRAEYAVPAPLRERIRVCASDDCSLLFVDASRPGQRRWCSMNTCGRRAKMATYRATD
jgi:sugar lactone lactonase YvrE